MTRASMRPVPHDDPQTPSFGIMLQDAVDLIDAGLTGPSGALAALRKLSSWTHTLTLSHNNLGDAGVQALSEGLLAMRLQGKQPGIITLNLASNKITDRGLYHLIKNLLLPSERPYSLPPVLKHLYLASNEIELDPSGPVPSLLSAALSHPSSSLEFLSLTNNSQIHLKRFLAHCTPTSLVELHLNACAIRIVKPLVDWLERSSGTLEALKMNGNFLAERGVDKLQQVIIQGRNLRILDLQLAANSRPDDLTINFAEGSDSDSDSVDDSQDEHVAHNDNGGQAVMERPVRGDLLGVALSRNFALRWNLRLAALNVLRVARILLLAKPPEQKTCTDMIGPVSSHAVLPLKLDALRVSQTTAMPSSLWAQQADARQNESTFPWLKLPAEIRVEIFRHLGAFYPIDASLLPNKNGKTKTTAEGPHVIQVSPLSERQLLNILSYAQHRMTLKVAVKTSMSPDYSASAHTLQVLRQIDCAQWQ